jgi:trimethylamine--corrinoid protein Co-methyltransferase
LCRELLKTAPGFHPACAQSRPFVQIGGDATVFAPVYGPPFVRDLDGERRYATIEDFRNFVKLAYMAPAMHHSGGTVCEPVDMPVNKRHLDMVYSHIKLSTNPSWAR